MSATKFSPPGGDGADREETGSPMPGPAEGASRAMNRFVRLIFAILGLSIVCGLAVVVLANARSGREQRAQVALENQRFGELLERLDSHYRRAEVTVDWQKVDAEGQVTETGLLVRQFAMGAGEEEPLEVERVVIPGSSVRLDAVVLTYGAGVPDEFAAARGKRVALFAHVYGAGQAKGERFSFLTPDRVPAGAQVHADRITHGETVFWNYTWEFIRAEEWGRTGPEAAVKVTWLAPAERTVRRGLLYTAIAAMDGVTIQETDDRRVVNEIRMDATKQDSTSRPN